MSDTNYRNMSLINNVVLIFTFNLPCNQCKKRHFFFSFSNQKSKIEMETQDKIMKEYK